ncbi:pentapeptide repeat-containing protein [uncultured Litoreibacter sp.]|uniref:pentapeptide repeat-containing protein n=1 Tax=uncultured Litoreibacter sp. TaxID=1392394 RepID=UPI00260916E6|nr:pentapeptide repeat-containing protein [uncultured Litoreibacter sp.]
MANPQHLEWLREGVDAWNARMREKRFVADLQGADLQGADLQRTDLRGADLRGADLQGALLLEADLQGADLQGADLQRAHLRGTDLQRALLKGALVRGAGLQRADVRTIVYSAERDALTRTAEYTDLSKTRLLTQNQVNLMRGDSGTILPQHITPPAHWPEVGLEEEPPVESAFHSDETARGPSPVQYTPPAAFKTEDNVIDIRHTPQRPEPREASQTPIDNALCEKTRKALLHQTRTIVKLLTAYENEDSNRAENAAQIAITCKELCDALDVPAEDFLPTLLEDYIEAIAIGYGEDIHAFETNDRAAIERLIKRGRQHYACYPELVEIADPENTRFIPDTFPYTVASLTAEIDDIVYGDESETFFSNTTRTLIEAEKTARVPRDVDPNKSKLARLGAITAEMWREMEPQRERIKKLGLKGKDGVDKATAWLKTFEKVQKIWEAIEPYIGKTPDA